MVNTAPVITSATAGVPNTSTGAVNGKVTASDADGNALRFAAKTNPTGKVTIGSANGAFTYTPTAAARHAASAVTNPATQDTVTVTVTDGKGGVATQAVAVAIAPKNTAPTATVRVGSPNTTTGVVSGNVTGSDADRDPLSYTAPTSTLKGTVAIDAKTGAFTYTPTAAARHAAAATVAPTSAKTDTFNVTVMDAHGGTVTKAVTVTVAPKNSAPTVAATPTVGAPNLKSGVVTGNLAAIDADGDSLSYKASPTKGSITFGSGGSFTYTPTEAARAAAAKANAPASAKQDTFTVTVTDGYGGTTTKTVTATVAPTAPANAAATVVGAANVTGLPWGMPLPSPDGSHALITTMSPTGYTTRVISMDSTTGSTGPVLTLSGSPEGVQSLSADGTRTLITTSLPEPTGGYVWTRMAVMNTVSGAQTGSTVVVPGTPTDPPLLTTDRKIAVVTTTNTYNTTTGDTWVAVVDNTTGTQVGQTVKLAGISWAPTQLSADGKRALVTTYVNDQATGKTSTRVAVIDTATGAQIGDTRTFAGEAAGSLLLDDNGSHALITTQIWDQAIRRDTIHAAVIDTTTGAQTGDTVILTGGAWRDFLQLSADGTNAQLTTFSYDFDTDTTYTSRIRVSAIDTTTGAQTGTTVTVDGQATTARPSSADGTRAVVTTTAGVIAVDTVTGTQTAVSAPGTARTPVLSTDGRRALVAVDSATTAQTTELVVIDTATGGQVGTKLAVAGRLSDAQLLSADAGRALITTLVPNPATGWADTRVTVIDTSTGAQSGTTVLGYPSGSPQLNAKGTRALVTTGVFDGTTTTTRVAVIDTATGNQIGTPVTLAGAPKESPVFSADGAHALISTSVVDPKTGAASTWVSVVEIGELAQPSGVMA